MCVSARMYAHLCVVPKAARSVSDSLELEILGGGLELPDVGARKQNPALHKSTAFS